MPLQSTKNHLNSEYDKALMVYEKMLAFEMDQVQRANIQKRIGDNCLEIIRQKNDLSSCERAIAAYEDALLVFTPKSHAIPRAKVMRGLGVAYAALADYKNRAKNLKLTVIYWEEALQFFSLTAAPHEHAGIQNELGSAYRKLAELESRQENGKKAVEACKAALCVYNLKDNPQEFAAAKTFLGSSYLTLAQSANPTDHAKCCHEAILAYREAIQVYSLERSPMQYAAMMNNLAIAYLSLSETEDKTGNCRLALAACREALIYRTEKEHPLAYAATQNNLGNAYLALAQEDREGSEHGCLENCRLALTSYSNALRIYSPEEHPRLYATAQNNLANVYLTMGQKVDETVDKTSNCMKAILAAQKAQEVFTLEDSPEDYSEALGSLWLAYLTLADIEYRAENCALALQACEQRLHSYRLRAAHPLQIASCSKDLAMTAIMLADNEISTDAKAEDCKKAISACHEALQIFDASSYPEEYAEAQVLLWAAYFALAEVEDCKENCRLAIAACQDAIVIYERINPAEHADALKNLGYSYITMAEMEDRAGNCQRAINACEQAMQYYTPETAPLEHADILRDLAFAYITISEVSDKEECSKKALKAYEKASKIYRTGAEELERAGDASAEEVREKAERCLLFMQSCKAVLKAGRKAGAGTASTQKKQKSEEMMEEKQGMPGARKRA